MGSSLARMLHTLKHPRTAGDVFKAVIYTLLAINLGVYAWDDWVRAQQTLAAGAPLIRWADEFATTIDDSAWLVLVLLYELETAWLSNERYKGLLKWIMQGTRVLCAAAIVRTFIVYAVAVHTVHHASPMHEVSSLCDLAGQDQIYVYNEEYTNIGFANCGELGDGAEYFRIKSTIVTDAQGLRLHAVQAWMSAAESVLWIVIVVLIEIMLQLQGRGVSGGPLIRAGNGVNAGCYFVIAGIASTWAWMGHPVYLWDDILWIGGFLAISMNLSRWREEMRSNV